MSKKHFDAVAKDIREQVEIWRKLFAANSSSGTSSEYGVAEIAVEALLSVALALSHSFAQFNPNFDRRRFLAACGLVNEAKPYVD